MKVVVVPYRLTLVSFILSIQCSVYCTQKIHALAKLGASAHTDNTHHSNSRHDTNVVEGLPQTCRTQATV